MSVREYKIVKSQIPISNNKPYAAELGGWALQKDGSFAGTNREMNMLFVVVASACLQRKELRSFLTNLCIAHESFVFKPNLDLRQF